MIITTVVCQDEKDDSAHFIFDKNIETVGDRGRDTKEAFAVSQLEKKG
jgi:hypothetical protein